MLQSTGLEARKDHAAMLYAVHTYNAPDAPITLCESTAAAYTARAELIKAGHARPITTQLSPEGAATAREIEGNHAALYAFLNTGFVHLT